MKLLCSQLKEIVPVIIPFRLSGLPGFRGVSRSLGQVRAEASPACTFLYIVSIDTDPKHNAGTFFPTKQLRWLTGCRSQ